MAEAIVDDLPCPPSAGARTKNDDFESMVKANQARILRLALGMMRDRAAAEDIAQETFLRAFRFQAGFRGESSVSTWLYRVAMNLCLDAQRKLQARVLQPIDDTEESPPDPARSPEESLELSQMAKKVELALETVGSKHRAILLLREVEGLSYEEISAVLEIPLGTVMSRLHHARMKLFDACRDLDPADSSRAARHCP